MKMFRNFWVSILSAFGTVGCGREIQRQEFPERALPRIDSKSEPGFADLVFAIRSRERLTAGGERLVAAALDAEREVAFVITLGPQWKAGSLGGLDLVTYAGLVTIGTVGPRSDELLRTMDRRYATKLAPRTMSGEVKFSGISLGGNPAALDAGETKIKLFFESDDEDRYAEVFLNIDAPNGTIEWSEKDLDYRAALVRALSASELEATDKR